MPIAFQYEEVASFGAHNIEDAYRDDNRSRRSYSAQTLEYSTVHLIQRCQGIVHLTKIDVRMTSKNIITQMRHIQHDTAANHRNQLTP